MSETTGVAQPELPDILKILGEKFHDNVFFEYVSTWENIVFSLIIIFIISLVAYLASRKLKMVPGKLQNFVEFVVGGLDDFVCGILGPKGRKFTPFIGTIFIYILCMNLSGLIPFIKASTTSWSTTLALSLCVFVYVQYTAFKELGFFGYFDHLAGKPRGIMAFSIIMPLMMFFLHLIAELIRPLSLSLRLRSNIWGDDLLLAVLARFGLPGLPILFFNMLIALLTAVIQAVVFTILATVYFALVMEPEEEHIGPKEKAVKGA